MRLLSGRMETVSPFFLEKGTVCTTDSCTLHTSLCVFYITIKQLKRTTKNLYLKPQIIENKLSKLFKRL